MAVSLRASKHGLKLVDQARKKKGWTAIAAAWCDEAKTSLATLKRFRQGLPIQQDTFKEICRAVGVEWEEIVDNNLSPVTTSKTEFFIVLSGTVQDYDKQKAEAIVGLLQPLLVNPIITIEEIRKGSVVLVLLGDLEHFERIEYLFKTEQLTELLGVTVEDVRLATINLSQWLEDFLDGSWQTLEEVLGTSAANLVFSLRQGDRASGLIGELIEQLQNSQDDEQQQSIIRSLGDIGSGNREAIAALVNVLRSAENDNTLWTAAESLWIIDPNNSAGGVKRAKLIDGAKLDSMDVVLFVAILPKVNRQLGILLRVYRAGDRSYLPPQLKLTVLDESGATFLKAEATNSDIGIQLKLSGEPGERFSVKIALGEASVTEDFVI